jgi:uncharacterized protein
MQRNPVGWFEISVSDMARAKAFYESMLGVQLQKLEMPGMEMWAFPMAEGAEGAAGSLIKGEDSPRPGVGGTVVYFSCEDCAEQCGRAGAGGGRVVQEKMSIGEFGYVAVITDPDGNLIGLHSTS